MKRSKLLSIPGLVLFLLFVTATAAFAQESQPISNTVSISVTVQKPVTEVRFTHEYSFPVVISNTGEFTANVTGELLLYYAHITDITTTLPITANYAFTPTAFRSSAAFTLTEPIAPGEVVTLTVICAQDQVPGPVWADVEITATPLVTEVLGTSVFSTIAWDAQTPYDFALSASITPTNILTREHAFMLIGLESHKYITETRTIIHLTGFGVVNWTVLGDGPVSTDPQPQIGYLSAAEAQKENAKLELMKQGWQLRKDHYVSHLSALAAAHPEMAQVMVSQVFTDPVFISVAEGDPFIVWTPEGPWEHLMLIDFELAPKNGEHKIDAYMTGSHFQNYPLSEWWKLEEDGNNYIHLKEDRDFSIIDLLEWIFLPMIIR